MVRPAAVALTLLYSTSQVLGGKSHHVARQDPSISDRLNPPIVSAPLGTYRGVHNSDRVTDSFLGIPFAQPPVGDLRFRQAVAAPALEGTFPATQFGPGCLQFPFMSNETQSLWPANVKAWYDQYWAVDLEIPPSRQSEDCLTLNVFRPRSATARSNLPVIVWIHGGGSIAGAAYGYDGGAFVKRSIDFNEPAVFVSIQYRLHVFGYLAGSQILSQRAANLGLYDQRMALTWVQQNIKSFGGDPRRVLLTGQSAGSQAVAANIIADRSSRLFSSAWMFSGSLMANGPVDAPAPQAAFDGLVAATGCTSASDQVQCLRGLSAADLLVASAPFTGAFYGNVRGPDGLSLSDQPTKLLKSGKHSHVPLVNGQVDDEGPFISMSAPAVTYGTPADALGFLNLFFYGGALSPAELAQISAAYPDDAAHQSPFGVPGPAAGFGPSFKYLAAVGGDMLFTTSRRTWLSSSSKTQPSWSYNYKRYKSLVPQLGSVHGLELFEEVFGPGANDSEGDLTRRLLSFAANLNPNYAAARPQWPVYNTQSRKLFVWGEGTTKTIESDTYRLAETTLFQQLFDAHPQ